MKVLYIGVRRGTSLHRANALRRIGHEVDVFSPRRQLVSMVPGLSLPWLRRWIRFTGAWCLESLVLWTLRSASVINQSFDLVHVDDVALAGPSLVSTLKKKFGPVSCYVNDNPFSDRDGPKWRLFLDAIPEYDLVTVVREPNVQQAYDHGAKNVLRTYFSADEVAHAPVEMTPQEKKKWRSDVIFVGTWYPGRGEFMRRLIERGIPLTLRGNSWEKADEWPVLKRHWEGPAVYEDKYVKALQSAKICLGLLSDGNRDLHTQRSMEIPYIGSLFCAERTKEHCQLYDEGREAVFWEDAEECADVCLELLEDGERRQNIAARGRQRCIENGYLNENVMGKVVDGVLAAAQT